MLLILITEIDGFVRFLLPVASGTLSSELVIAAPRAKRKDGILLKNKGSHIVMVKNSLYTDDLPISST